LVLAQSKATKTPSVSGGAWGYFSQALEHQIEPLLFAVPSSGWSIYV
jgi:hypothetical protein